MKQSEIKIQNSTILVDKCIAKEVLQLNNKCNIKTLSSCCGHDGTWGMSFIVCCDEDKQKMLDLGYKLNGRVKSDYLEEPNKWYTSFRPKSICKCKVKRT